MCVGGGPQKPKPIAGPKPIRARPPREAPKRVDPEVLRRRDKSRNDRLREQARGAGGSGQQDGPLETTESGIV